MQLFVKNLCNIDFSYLDPSRGLLGETWLASIYLTGDLDDQGMICDFGIVKQVVRQWLDEEVDHKLLVPGKSKALQLTDRGGNHDIHWQLNDGRSIRCSSPRSAVTIIGDRLIDARSVAAWCEGQLMARLPGSIHKLELSLQPENISDSYYHYSHGLKKHGGNCQRIAHGHRSTIEIFRNGGRDRALEEKWARTLKDCYIGTREDLIDRPKVDEHEYCVFAYTTPQGEFSLTLPSAHCYLIDTDTTVEFIARHIAKETKQAAPTDNFVVRAYEGLGKGAAVSV